ncbi:hypothetical protein BP6252_03838 [Coleophoma cylindrospora]|uniref:Major facilitator superfamily (MFS) profile domain-containing protein n=1 Tax=Coleophoma cylindrospora TaxID=1849047 RepID=A0A3D8S8P7_9HELO|nr:hypothetical protein BP6252_03838 [Coleophoma cylindrospora]
MGVDSVQSAAEDAEKTAPVATPTDVAEEETYLTGAKLYQVLIAVTLAGYITTLDSSIVATAIPRITDRFNSLPDVGWYGSAYLISLCACQPSSGKLYENHSLKYVFFSFLVTFEVGSLLCGLAQSSKMLIVGRAISGIGGSGLVNGALTILGSAAPKDKRPRKYFLDLSLRAELTLDVIVLTGTVMSMVLVGILSGPLLGGVITQRASWRWCFLINLPAGGFTALVLLISPIPQNSKGQGAKLTIKQTIARLDPVGFLTFAPTCVMFLLALEWGGTKYPWKSATIIGLFCGGAGMLLVFGVFEHRRGDTAMIPLALLRQRALYCSCLASVFLFGGIQTFAYYMPIWFQTIKGATPSMSGVDFLPSILSMIIATMIAGFAVSKVGYYTPFAIVGNGMSAIGGGLLTTLVPSTPASRWIGFQVLTGLGRGLAMQQSLTAVQTRLPKSQIAVGTTLVVFTQYFGGALFLAVAQTIFSASLGPALAEWAPDVSKELVVSVGATAVRGVVSEAQLPGVLLAYNQALVHTWYLPVASAVAAFCASWGLGWGSVKTKKKASSAV